ncbi:hypothetical protein [Prevotella corporis]|uniref:hypothetical protein n=1 Tax=Prevotella corporis TaxID=28128 RepID=UPI0023664BBC|nr:hypothetical protein [Prevotella corporis]
MESELYSSDAAIVRGVFISINPGDLPKSQRKFISTIPKYKKMETINETIDSAVFVYHGLPLYKFIYQGKKLRIPLIISFMNLKKTFIVSIKYAN